MQLEKNIIKSQFFDFIIFKNLISSDTSFNCNLSSCGIPSNPVTSGIGLDVANLGWDTVTGALSYVVRYKEVTQPWTASIYDTVNTNIIALSGLSSGTYYQWQVASMCDANGNNTSNWSSQVTFTTSSCNLILSTLLDSVSCYGGSDGLVDLSVSGGSGIYTYLWSNGSTTEDLTGLSSGNYSVTVIDSWGCTNTTSVTIVEPATPFTVAIQSAGSSSVCIGSDVLLFMSSNGSPFNTYQWSDSNGVIAGATNTAYTATSSGIYSLTSINANGCIATSDSIVVDIITVTPPIGLFTSNIGLTQATMHWTAVSGAHHYDVRYREQGTTTWIMYTTILVDTFFHNIFNQSTTYEWEVRSACSTDSSLVSLWSSTEVFMTTSPCIDPTNLITSNITSNSATLNWDAVSAAWGYVIRYTEWGNFSNWTYDTVNTNIYNIACLSNTTDYYWQVASMCSPDGSNTSSFSSCCWLDQNFTTDTSSSCSFSASISIDTTHVSCFGDSDGSIDLSLSSGSFTYLWSNGDTTEDLTGLSAGNYSVTITNNNVCCDTLINVTITAPVTPFSIAIQSAGSTTVCAGSSVVLSMTTFASPANTYQWNNANGAIPGATSSTYNAITSGSYSLTVTNIDGCIATSNSIVVDIITVTAPTGLFTSNIGLNQVTLNWTAAVTGVHHYDVRIREQGNTAWTQYTVILSNSLYLVVLDQCTPYEWEVRSACSTDSSSVSIWSFTEVFTTQCLSCVVPSNPVTSGIGLDVATLGWDTVSGAWGYVVRYKEVVQPWSAWIYDTVNTNTLALSGLLQGTSYHWQVASMCDANGNNTSAWASPTTFLTGSCNITLNTTYNDVNCFGDSDGSIDLSVSGGSGSYTYLWSDGSTTEDVSGLSAGLYSVVVTDSWGCTGTTSVTITEPNQLFANAFSNDISCFGSCDGSAFSTPTGGTSPYSYVWSNGNITDNILGLCSGLYSVVVTDTLGCTTTNTVTIIEPNQLFVNIFSNDISCFGSCDGSTFSMPSGGTPPYSYQWSNGNITNNVSGLCSGLYSVFVTDNNGCTSTDSIVVIEPPLSVSYDTLSLNNAIFWNGAYLVVSGDYYCDTLIDVAGCDSIANLNLTIITTGIINLTEEKNHIRKVFNLLGQETIYRKNTPLFFLYDDGRVEKRVIIE